MHGERIGVAQSPVVAASYLAVSVILFLAYKFAAPAPKPAEEPSHGHAPEGVPA